MDDAPGLPVPWLRAQRGTLLRWLLSLLLTAAPLWAVDQYRRRPAPGPVPLELVFVRLPAAPAGEPAPPPPTQSARPVSAPEVPPDAPPANAGPVNSLPAAADAVQSRGVEPDFQGPEALQLPAPSPANAEHETVQNVKRQISPRPNPPNAAAVPPAIVPPTATEDSAGRRPAPRQAARLPRPPPRPPGSSSSPVLTASSPDAPVEPSELDEGFRLLEQGKVRYPARARRLGRGGEARVELEVDTQGRVRRITVLHETRGWGFGKSALRAYRNARFTRPTAGGRPVRVLWRKTLRFRP